MFIRLRDQRGDTIVEVLIAIAIVSLTLTGAYASVNRSSNAVRTAQERGEALKWAETQVEQLKAAATAPGAATFCYNPDLTLTTTIPCASTGPVPYRATITKSVSSPGSYSVMVTWDAINGGADANKVELDYIK